MKAYAQGRSTSAWLDGEVLGRIKEIAESLGIPFSNPNNVLRIVLGLPPHDGYIHQPTTGVKYTLSMDVEDGKGQGQS
ncbi:MAG: hypothetical protein PHQ43_16075 [Dehalococcoidales bacterium]|nr:hypothetical protein [Dehalococcoidales bacterium]